MFMQTKHLIRKLVRYVSLLLLPVGILMLVASGKVAVVIIKYEDGFVALGLLVVLACLVALICYAFLYAPLRVFKKLDSAALDALCVAVSLSFMFLTTGLLALLPPDMPRLGGFVFLGSILLFVALRAGAKYLLEA